MICSIIFIFSFIANFNSKEIILDIGLTIRSLLIFIMTFIYFSLITKVLQQKHNKEIYLLKIILFTGSTLVIMSTVQLVIFGLPRFNYPFTLEGADPQLFMDYL